MNGHQHIWQPRSGRPLSCGECGEIWPGDSAWPPEPFMTRNEGYGPLGDGHIPWRRRVDHVIAQLSEVA